MGNYLAKSNKLLRNFEYRRFYYQSNLSTMWKDRSSFSGDDFDDFFFFFFLCVCRTLRIQIYSDKSASKIKPRRSLEKKFDNSFVRFITRLSKWPIVTHRRESSSNYYAIDYYRDRFDIVT